MEITTGPSCRVGWQGATLGYVVKAPGASEIIVPGETDGMQVRVLDTVKTADGVEARLAVKVLDSTPY